MSKLIKYRLETKKGKVYIQWTFVLNDYRDIKEDKIEVNLKKKKRVKRVFFKDQICLDKIVFSLFCVWKYFDLVENLYNNFHEWCSCNMAQKWMWSHQKV